MKKVDSYFQLTLSNIIVYYKIFSNSLLRLKRFFNIRHVAFFPNQILKTYLWPAEYNVCIYVPSWWLFEVNGSDGVGSTFLS